MVPVKPWPLMVGFKPVLAPRFRVSREGRSSPIQGGSVPRSCSSTAVHMQATAGSTLLRWQTSKVVHQAFLGPDNFTHIAAMED